MGPQYRCISCDHCREPITSNGLGPHGGNFREKFFKVAEDGEPGSKPGFFGGELLLGDSD